MFEHEIEFLNAYVEPAQKARELPQHSLEWEEQRLGARQLEVEIEVSVVSRWKAECGARVGRLAHQSIQVIAHLRSETFGNRIARQLEHEADRSHARGDELLTRMRRQHQALDGQMLNSLIQALYARRRDAYFGSREEGCAFERRADPEPIGVAQFAKLAFDRFEQGMQTAEQFQARADLDPQSRP